MKNSKSSIEKLSLEILKQHHNKYTHKLNHLKLKNGIPIDTPNLNIHKKSSKTRRFVPRRKYQQWKKVEATKKNLGLIHNFSDINLSNGMISLLNKGPGFVLLEHTLNVTQTMADLNKYERRIRWCEYFSNEVTNLSDHIHDEHENLSMNNTTLILEDERVDIPSIFKTEKSNLPKSNPPKSLQIFLSAIKSDILGSCKKNQEFTRQPYS